MCIMEKNVTAMEDLLNMHVLVGPEANNAKGEDAGRRNQAARQHS